MCDAITATASMEMQCANDYLIVLGSFPRRILVRPASWSRDIRRLWLSKRLNVIIFSAQSNATYFSNINLRISCPVKFRCTNEVYITERFDGEAEVANRRGEHQPDHPAISCRDGPSNCPADGNANPMRSRPFQTLASLRMGCSQLVAMKVSQGNTIFLELGNPTVATPWELSIGDPRRDLKRKLNIAACPG